MLKSPSGNGTANKPPENGDLEIDVEEGPPSARRSVSTELADAFSLDGGPEMGTGGTAKLPPSPTLWKYCRALFVVGLQSFGGWQQIENLRHEVVIKRSWIDDARFTDLVTLAQYLPGPTGVQVAAALGASWGGGVRGALVSTVVFTWCGAALIYIFARGIRQLSGGDPQALLAQWFTEQGPVIPPQPGAPLLLSEVAVGLVPAGIAYSLFCCLRRLPAYSKSRIQVAIVAAAAAAFLLVPPPGAARGVPLLLLAGAVCTAGASLHRDGLPRAASIRPDLRRLASLPRADSCRTSPPLIGSRSFKRGTLFRGVGGLSPLAPLWGQGSMSGRLQSPKLATRQDHPEGEDTFDTDDRGLGSSFREDRLAGVGKGRGRLLLLGWGLGMVILMTWHNAIASPTPWLVLAEKFYRFGSQSFGGDHFVLAGIHTEIHLLRMLPPSMLLLGLGVVHLIPGNVFTISMFVGALFTGREGLLAAYLGIHLTALCAVLGTLPFWDVLRHSSHVLAALTGVNAAGTGIEIGIVALLFIRAVSTAGSLCVAVVTIALVTCLKVAAPWAILSSAFFGWLLYRRDIGGPYCWVPSYTLNFPQHSTTCLAWHNFQEGAPLAP